MEAFWLVFATRSSPQTRRGARRLRRLVHFVGAGEWAATTCRNSVQAGAQCEAAAAGDHDETDCKRTKPQCYSSKTHATRARPLYTHDECSCCYYCCCCVPDNTRDMRDVRLRANRFTWCGSKNSVNDDTAPKSISKNDHQPLNKLPRRLKHQ